MEDSPFPSPEGGVMEDSNWLESIRFYALPLAEKRKLLLDRRERLLEQQNRLELQRRELKAQQARLKQKRQALATQMARLEQQ
jgi:hypothetical protein